MGAGYDKLVHFAYWNYFPCQTYHTVDILERIVGERLALPLWRLYLPALPAFTFCRLLMSAPPPAVTHGASWVRNWRRIPWETPIFRLSSPVSPPPSRPLLKRCGICRVRPIRKCCARSRNQRGPRLTRRHSSPGQQFLSSRRQPFSPPQERRDFWVLRVMLLLYHRRRIA